MCFFYIFCYIWHLILYNTFDGIIPICLPFFEHNAAIPFGEPLGLLRIYFSYFILIIYLRDYYNHHFQLKLSLSVCLPTKNSIFHIFSKNIIIRYNFQVDIHFQISLIYFQLVYRWYPF